MAKTFLQRVLVIAISIVVIGLFTYGVYRVFTPSTERIPEVIKKPTTTPDSNALPVPLPEDLIANWKTYTNDKYGFSTKYPKDWQVNEKPLSVYPDAFTIALTFTNPSGQDKIFFNVRPKDDEGMIREALTIISEEKIIVGGIEGAKITGAGQKEGSPRETSVLVTKGIYVYYFWFLQPFKEEVIFSQMLSTFRFIR